jgi:hypothetical protein
MLVRACATLADDATAPLSAAASAVSGGEASFATDRPQPMQCLALQLPAALLAQA